MVTIGQLEYKCRGSLRIKSHPHIESHPPQINGQLSRARTVADYSGNYFVDYSSLSLQQEWYENGQQG